MNNNVLRKPLLNTAVVFTFFIGLLAVSIAYPEATVFQSIGLLIQAVLRAVQLLIGLALAAAFCVAVLIGSFLGAVFLFNKETAASMYAELRQTLTGWLLLFGKEKIVEPVNFEPVKEEMRQELQANIEAIQGHIHATRELLAGKIGQLSSRIDVLEDLTAKMADNAQVEALRSEVRGAMTTLAGIEGAVGGMKACVEQTAQQILQISPEKLLGDLPERLRLLEQREPEVIDITPLERDIAVMQQELASVREKADKALLAASAEPAAVPPVMQEPSAASAAQEAPLMDEHRLFSYFDDPADKQKIVELIEAALEKGLNQKQIIDYLTRALGTQKGKIVSAHPAVFKDYLKTCRRND
ncbi:MAG: hypothetical protein ACTFAL_10470 [Candidatus Electronema sp. V4]|uniref:hypothetical protein n=1 Tax=Candidatus Electronema sp. V4 TaxID=3454756 RepID=UPI0040555A46